MGMRYEFTTYNATNDRTEISVSGYNTDGHHDGPLPDTRFYRLGFVPTEYRGVALRVLSGVAEHVVNRLSRAEAFRAFAEVVEAFGNESYADRMMTALADVNGARTRRVVVVE